MSRARPIDQESPFAVHELFFSRTDTRGIISAGNSVFVRVSEHTWDDLENQPHNIIRHPDMPKTVFKLLWDTIQAGRPIGAYVKNMSKTGRYYWVYAAVFPIEGGFLSLRLKPTSAVLKTINELYRTVLAEEKKGLELGLKVVVDAVKKLGFQDYERFMAYAMSEEMKARDGQMAGRPEPVFTSADQTMNRRITGSRKAGREIREVFSQVMDFVKMSEDFRKATQKILEDFQKLDHLAINMAVGAEKAGRAGATLAEVSEGFKRVAQDIEVQITSFNQTMSELNEALDRSQFQVAACRLQLEMMCFFIGEAVASTDVDPKVFEENHKVLAAVAGRYLREVYERMAKLSQTSAMFTRRIDDLMQAVSGLQVIRVTGKIETASLPDAEGAAFGNHIQEMQRFISGISGPLKTLADVAQRFRDGAQTCLQRLEQSTVSLTGAA